MKIQLCYFMVFMMSFCFTTSAQNTTIGGSIPFSHTNTTQWHQRCAQEINRYKEENKKMRDKSCDVLFLGSSTISFWRTIHQDPLCILNYTNF